MESKALTEITDLIANNQIKEAIQLLRKLLDGNPLLDDVILQSARYSDLKQQIRLGTIDYEIANISKSKIRLALLEMIGELQDKAEQDEKVKLALESAGSELNVNQLNAESDIIIKAAQKKSKADISDLDSGGKIEIDIKQK